MARRVNLLHLLVDGCGVDPRLAARVERAHREIRLLPWMGTPTARHPSRRANAAGFDLNRNSFPDQFADAA